MSLAAAHAGQGGAHPGEVLGLFAPGGELRAADPEFSGLLGPLAAQPAPGAAPRFWEAHGFVADPGRPGTRRKGGRSFACTLRPVGGWTLARIEDVTEAGEDVQRRQGLLSFASHDLRAPLANVRSYASLLMGPRSSLDERARRAVEVMGRNADRALSLISSLFDLLRAEVGALRLEPSAEPLLPALREAELRARVRAREAGVLLEARWPPEVGATWADPDRLRQILDAFWENAIARSSPGQGVGAELAEREGDIRVTFWDSGPALTGAEAAHAFDAGFVVCEARKLDAGFERCVAGALVSAQGGSVAVAQEPGQTRFSFTVRKAASGAEEPPLSGHALDA